MTKTLLLGFYPRETKTCVLKGLAASLIIAPNWKQSKCLSAKEWMTKLWHIHTVRSYSVREKETTTDSHGSMAGPQNHDAEWKNPCTKEYPLCDSFIWSSGIGKTKMWRKESEQRLPLGRGSLWVCGKFMRDLCGVTDRTFILIAVWVYAFVQTHFQSEVFNVHLYRYIQFI